MKKLTSLFACFLLAIGLASCASVPPEPEADLTDPSQSSSSGSDMSVQLEQCLTPADIDGKEIQSVYAQSNRFKPYDTIAQLCSDAEQIIRGVIRDVSYYYEYNSPSSHTMMNVTVEEVLYGDLQIGDTVSACKGGGFMPLKDAYPDIQARNPDLTDQELENTVLETISDGDPHPSAGQEVLLFLCKDASAPYNAWAVISGYEGQFTKEDDGLYRRHYEERDYSQPSAKTRTFADPDTANQPFTLNQLRDQIQSHI